MLDDVRLVLLAEDPRRCEFGICRRLAEQEVVIEDVEGVVLKVTDVCALHVTPVAVWGQPEPVEVLVRELQRPISA